MLIKALLVGTALMLPIQTILPVSTVAPEFKQVVQHSVEKSTAKKEVKVKTVNPSPKPKKVRSVSTPKGEHQLMEVTGYTAGYESTQKHPGHPEYGITASGTYVKQGRTIAASKGIPFGTRVYIPYFKGKKGFGDGIFIVEDRGGAIGPGKIDVYFESYREAIKFGRHQDEDRLDVYILED